MSTIVITPRQILAIVASFTAPIRIFQGRMADPQGHLRDQILVILPNQLEQSLLLNGANDIKDSS
jgi:hypothetical protein